MKNQRYINVVLSVGKETFTYSVPEEMDCPEVGTRVIVPFGKTRKIGIVTSYEHTPKHHITIREAENVIDSFTLLNNTLLTLAQWLADYYINTFPEALRTMLPASFLKRKLEMKTIARVITNSSAKFPSPSPPKNKPKLTSEQEKAFCAIGNSLKDGENKVFLLYGITGSGKTEIYLRAVELALTLSKTAMILVPEIALTVQLIQVFKERFPEKVAVLHSKLSPTEYAAEWYRLQSGEASISIGVRSSVFCPIKNPGLIVVDEEHDPSYKCETGVRYNAKDVALFRGQMSNAVVILGSATPSVESAYLAGRKNYQFLELKKRIDNRMLPTVHLVDLRNQQTIDKESILSKKLVCAIEERLDRSEQSLIFLNRRGFSSVVICKGCGFYLKCPHCDVSLTYHMDKSLCLCHYCGYAMNIPDKCPCCKEGNIHLVRTGLQKIESRLNKLFPAAKIIRLDRDSTTKKNSFQHYVNKIKKEEVDIVLGTQMVTKGHDFPKITLVGVILAEHSLGFADFRAAERTFQLLTQVSGRAGRGQLPGEVLIQTYNPAHYSIVHATKYDVQAFYEREFWFRSKFYYPPYSQIINIVFEGKKLDNTYESAKKLSVGLKNGFKKGIKISGPLTPFVRKIRDKNRFSVIVKAPVSTSLTTQRYIHATLRKFQQAGLCKGVNIYVDVDPISF